MKSYEIHYKAKIIEQVDSLSPELQRQLLDFACKLAGPKGISGKELLPFAGIMTFEEAQSINRAIEEGCEKVDVNEW
ncbi:MAG TPA: hypothetical protein PL110_13440 [Candidatus Eremiobacteraeota bacterium]|nr:MAG: hypothetical protein BWY64_00797 [bacterium ADurb.Bin363]HPZ09107.1 hypothetical protein [Candidatus Eremiobacteraeota bacterium]